MHMGNNYGIWGIINRFGS